MAALTLRYTAAPLRMQILKIRFFHVREGPNIDCEPTFHEATTLNIGDYPGQPKMGRFLTLRVMGSPPKNGNFEHPICPC